MSHAADGLAERARPKINLFLHVTGRRPDGYHLLDSLVVFAETGDTIRAEPAQTLSLSLDGPFAAGLDAGGENLVLKAAAALQEHAQAAGQDVPGAALHLEKRLPIASGIGGGSADAAAAMRLLRRLWNLDIEDAALETLALPLGADVPVCVQSRPRVMRGIGEALSEPPVIPKAWLVLVNPLRGLETHAVFEALKFANTPEPVPLPTQFDTAADLASWLRKETANELEAPARALLPEIGAVLGALDACDGALLSRMSGSGATCFGLFERSGEAIAAETRLRAAHTGWWIEAAALSARQAGAENRTEPTP